jgi:hypothetical protein
MTRVTAESWPVEVYASGVAKCWRCGERLALWDEPGELEAWMVEHRHDD